MRLQRGSRACGAAAHGLEFRSAATTSRSGLRCSAFVGDHREAGFITGARLVLGPLGFPPDLAIDGGNRMSPAGRRCTRVITSRSAMAIVSANMPAPPMMAISPRRAAARPRARPSARSPGWAPPRRPARQSPVAADHDVGAARQRLADREIGLAPHHHRLAHRQLCENVPVSDFSRHGRRPPARSRRFRRRRRRGRARCVASRRRVGYRPSRSLHSHRHLGLDMRMRVVAFEREILVAEGKQSFTAGLSPILGSGRGARASCSRACSRWLR